jgi:acetolactate synthase small subunit
MTPKAPVASASTTLNPIEMRLGGGLLALNRLVMTFQNKRMPVAGFTVGRSADGGALRATVILDCPAETARRYAALLSSLEDVEEIELSAGTVEVALLKTSGEGWRGPADASGVEAHMEGGTVVASGEPEKVEAWLGSIADEVEDIVRLGPVARPGNGGK